jgi:DNA-binding NarL/FixJ family response regulator
MLPLETAPEAITAAAVIHPSSLLVSLRLLFEAMWQQATRLESRADREGVTLVGSGLQLKPPDVEVVQLLVAGLTDQAIGRQLMVAERTVQRRAQGVMRTLGVANRLQLGMRLAEEGWGR